MVARSFQWRQQVKEIHHHLKSTKQNHCHPVAGKELSVGIWWLAISRWIRHNPLHGWLNPRQSVVDDNVNVNPSPIKLNYADSPINFPALRELVTSLGKETQIFARLRRRRLKPFNLCNNTLVLQAQLVLTDRMSFVLRVQFKQFFDIGKVKFRKRRRRSLKICTEQCKKVCRSYLLRFSWTKIQTSSHIAQS